MSYTLVFNFTLPSAGLTPSAQLVDTTGANVGSSISTGFVDLGDGFYSFTYASYPDGFRGTVKISESGTVKASTAINPQETEYTDVKTSTRLSDLTGLGAISHTHTSRDDESNPISGVEVWVTPTDDSSEAVLAYAITDADGQVQFMLDAGAYYLWEQHAGYTFDNPTQITVS